MTRPTNQQVDVAAQTVLPSGWRWARLGDVCDIDMGQSPDGASYNTDGNGIPLLNGPTEFGNTHPVPVQWTTAPTKICEPGNILLCVRGATTGRKNIADAHYCVGRGLASVRGIPSRTETEFLWFALDLATSTLQNEASGSTFPNLPGEKLRAIRIPLPPCSEQRRIAARLNAIIAEIDRARAAAQAALDAAASLQARLLSAAFEDGAANRWPRKRLGDLYDVRLGKMLSPASKTGRHYRPYLRNANIQWDRLDLSQVHEMDFADDEFQKFKLRKGDLLVCEGGEVARSAIWNDEIKDCCYQKAVHRVRPKSSDVEPRFLLYYLWYSAKRGVFGGLETKSTIAHLPAIRLKEIVIPHPGYAAEQTIAARLKEQMHTAIQLQHLCKKQLHAIDTLPTAYLQRAFKGDL